MQPGLRQILLGSTPSAETRTLLAAMTVQPSPGRAASINSFIRTLKTTGVWSILDVLYVTAAHDSQAARLNWKNPASFALSVTGAPVFTTDRGYAGDGSAALLTAASYNPSTAGLNYAQNAASFGAYVLTAGTAANAFAVSLGLSRLQRDAAVTGYGYRVNDGGASGSYTGAATGHFTARRTAAGARDLLRNAVSVANDTTASTGVATAFILFSSGASGFSNAQISVAYVGGNLSTGNVTDLDTAITTYLRQIGAI